MSDAERRYIYLATWDSGGPRVERYEVAKENRKTLTVYVGAKGSRGKVPKRSADSYAFATHGEALAHLKGRFLARAEKLEREAAECRRLATAEVPSRDVTFPEALR